jgi:hypothetical protein
VGTSRDPHELAGKLAVGARALQRAQRVAVANAALATKGVMLTGPPKSGLAVGAPIPRASGKPWSVGYSVKGTAEPSALIAYRGPVHWVEGGTKPHPVFPRKGARAARRGARAVAALTGQTVTAGAGMSTGVLSIPKIGARAYANSPGGAAKPFWNATKNEAKPVATKTVQTTLATAMVGAFA